MYRQILVSELYFVLSLVFSTLKKCPKLLSFFRRWRYKSPPSYNFCDDEPHFFLLIYV